jgi:hypothetical protein
MKRSKQGLWPPLLFIAGLCAAAILWWNLGWNLLRPIALLVPAIPAQEMASTPALLTAPPSAPAEVPSMDLPIAAEPLAASQVNAALIGFLGRHAVQRFIQLEDFPRKFVATVDNLGRSHAPPMMWPINPAAGRFKVAQGREGAVISDLNRLRYTPLVLLAEQMDIAQTVELYVRMYPLLQKSYEALGFPGRKFNDRLLQVIDQLLQTPPAGRTVGVQLVEVKGAVPSLRPWVRFEFVDPALESLSAGQKILLRIGPDNHKRIKAWLSALRTEILKHGQAQ